MGTAAAQQGGSRAGCKDHQLYLHRAIPFCPVLQIFCGQSLFRATFKRLCDDEMTTKHFSDIDGAALFVRA
jgi:hypothetical protein